MARLLDKQLRDQVTREMRPDQRKTVAHPQRIPTRVVGPLAWLLSRMIRRPGKDPKIPKAYPAGKWLTNRV